MRPTDIFKLYIYNPDTFAWVEYSDGIIDVDIKRGAQEYKGPFTQPDAGQMQIRTRSMEVDPYQNPLIRYNNRIRITAVGEQNLNNTTIFAGFIEGINVDYRPKSEDSIVTITAIDIVGQLYKHVLSESFIGLQEDWTTQELINQMSTNEEFDWMSGFTRVIADRPEYSTGPINSNTTAWDALTIRAKTDLGFLSAIRSSYNLSYISCDKDSPINPYNDASFNISDVYGQFRSDGTDLSYQSININDGFERVVNDITVKGFSVNTRSTNSGSVNIWRQVQANVNVSTNDVEDMQTIANEVLQEMSEPIREIFSITFDGTRYPDMAKLLDIIFSVEIVHEINDSLTIDRKYQIIGVNHKIDFNNWSVTLQLRNVAYQDTSIGNPIINITPATGTTITDFDFSYSIANPEFITGQSWDLDDGFTSTDPTTTVNYVTGGTKTITLTLDTIYGYQISSSVQLEVVGAAPSGTIAYTQTAGIYTFSFVGEPASTYYWQFGNGKTSNEPSPRTYYDTATSVNISLQVGNSYGTTTIPLTLSVVQSTATPVRYVKFKVKDAWRSVEELWDLVASSGEDRFSSTSNNYLSIKKIDITSAYSGLLTNVTMHNYIEYTNFITTSKTDRTNYTRSPRTLESEMVANWFGSGSVPMWVMSYHRSTPTYTNNSAHVGLEFVVDLQQEYLDLSAISIITSSNINNGRFEIEVSRDGENFKDAGYINKAPGSYYVPGVATSSTGTWPVPRTATTSTDDMTAYRKIRYIKMVSSDTLTVGEQWIVSLLFPFTGDYNWYQRPPGVTSRPWYAARNTYTFMGPPSTDSNTGANVEMTQLGTTGAINTMEGMVIPTGPILNTTRIFPPAALTRFNDLDTTRSYIWEEAYSGSTIYGGQKTFVYDLGEVRRNVSGIAFLNPGFYSSTNFRFTFYTSEDGLTWDALGEYIMYPTGQTLYDPQVARVIITPDVPSSPGNGFVRPIRNTDNATNMTNTLRTLQYN
jgi:hypothetical protein